MSSVCDRSFLLLQVFVVYQDTAYGRGFADDISTAAANNGYEYSVELRSFPEAGYVSIVCVM